MLQNLTFDEQFAMLDQKYMNTCRLFSHKLQLLDDRKISTSVDDYTMMISVMQGIYRQVESIEDKTNLLKYHLFMTKFPEVARREVIKQVNMIQEPEDMDKLLLDFDKFKWLLSENSDPTPKKTHNQQPRQDKKRAHLENSDRKKCAVKNCSESHGLWKCDLFKQMSTADQHELVVRSNICSRCLNSSQTLSSCTKDWTCRTDDCGGAHHALLHDSLKSVAKTVALVNHKMSAKTGYLGIQMLNVDQCDHACVLWDIGTNMHLVLADSGPTRCLWVPTSDNISDLGTRPTLDLDPPGRTAPDGSSCQKPPGRPAESKPSRIALAISAEPESRPDQPEEQPDDAPQTKQTRGWFPIKDYSCLKFAKKVMVRILRAADGFLTALEKNKGRRRATHLEIRASAHTLCLWQAAKISTHLLKV